MEALELAGHDVELASTFRSYDREGDAGRQQALRLQGEAHAHALAEKMSGENRPDAWFTYHLYYKAPDWLGPLVAEKLGIPYVVAEASYAPKRAGGPWSIGHDATAQALRRAARVFCPSRDDLACLEPLVPKARLELLPPFLDPAPYQLALAKRSEHRERLAREHSLDPGIPWIVVVAMMREGDKLASYRVLGKTLERIAGLRWRLLVAGDGPARAEIEFLLKEFPVSFLGTMESRPLAELYASGDVYAWPGVNEAYGMALLEAQAAGLPVVSSALRGIPDVVADGRTGLLAPAIDAAALAERLRALLVDPARRRSLGSAAARFVAEERSVAVAARRLATLP
jgi:glycosyltransferase involved in cell wall biosynthesis